RGARWLMTCEPLVTALCRALLGARRGGAPLTLLLPGVTEAAQLRWLRDRLDTPRASDLHVPPKVGAVIGSAARALSAGELSQDADLLDYDTGALTENVFGPECQAEPGVFPSDPRYDLDVVGVGTLVRAGQYRAGAKPSSFPASLSGAPARSPNGLL